jgi:ribosomal protein S18 acetylase RimI-like enzyme
METAEPSIPTIREFQPVDGPAVREFWLASGFRLHGDDDAGLARFAAHNPGLFLVVEAGGAIVGSAMGAWDGRRGWLYHVAVAAEHRRSGIGREMVARIEAGLRTTGCPRVNVIVGPENDVARAFWIDAGYEVTGYHQQAKDLA